MASPHSRTLGVIGVGNMGAALVRGFVQQQALAPDQIVVFDLECSRCEQLAKALEVRTTQDESDLLAQCDSLLVAVKPQHLPALFTSLAGQWSENHLVISIAAGLSLSDLRSMLGTTPHLVRVMPNLLCTVQQSASAFCVDADTSPEEIDFVRELFSAVGIVSLVDEKDMDAVTGLAGSGPAYVALFCEALADGGVAAGLSRSTAQELAAQVLRGSGEWLLSQGTPAELKDRVSSPAGTTIAGVRALESAGLRHAVMEAVLAAVERSRELGRTRGEE